MITSVVGASTHQSRRNRSSARPMRVFTVLALLTTAVQSTSAHVMRIDQSTSQKRARLTASLVAAAQAGDFTTAARLIDAGADVNAFVPVKVGSELIDEFFPEDARTLGPAPLIAYCVAHRQVGLVDKLIRKHTRVDARGGIRFEIYGTLVSEQNASALHVAAILGESVLVSKLLRAHADIGARDAAGNTPLALAIMFGKPEVSERLIAAGANVHVTNAHGDCPLILAAIQGDLAATKQLLRAGANTNSRDRTGKSALAWAAEYGHLPLVVLLIQARSDVNAVDDDGFSVLRRAAETGEQELYDYLKKAGARGEYKVEDLHGLIK